MSSLKTGPRPNSLLLSLAALSLLISSGCMSSDKQATVHPFGLQRRPPAPSVDDAEPDRQQAADTIEPEDDWSDRLNSAIASLTGSAPDHGLARQQFAAAENLYNSAAHFRQQAALEEAGESYLAAAETYIEAAGGWADSALQEDAWFMSGESYFFIDFYDKARDQYDQLLKDYPNSRHIDTVQRRRFAIAQYWMKEAELADRSFTYFNLFDESRPLRDSYNEAIRVFDQIRIQDPTGEIADDATMAGAVALMKVERFGQADVFLTDLRKTFPSSKHQFMAHYLGIQTKLGSYQGPAYDGGVLEEAEELTRQIRRQFPQQIKNHLQDISRMEAEVRFFQAQREWKVAAFYQNRNEIGAARLYYDGLIKDYPDTPFARIAKLRLEEIADLPARPAQYMTWLVDLFPIEEPAKPLLTSD